MGLLGLRKFIDAAGITRQLPVPHDEEPHNEDEDEKEDGPTSSTRATMVDHVLVDMNCIIHSCFGRTDVENKPKRDVIAAILDRLRILLTQVVIPRRSLTVCLDGPAPIAKLHTQRLRRRKASLMDCGANTQQQLNSLAITAGSLFLVELENALAAQFKLREGRGFLNRCCPVYLYGSTVMGEGEAKISRALAYLASGAEHGGPSSTWGSSSSSRAPPSYNPNDSVTILGNDIDLVLTGIAATHYQRITIIGPSSLQLINVSDILYRWMRASSTSGGDGAQPLTIQQLSSVRIDFIFLFLLNGGDHYVGAGEVAMGLWRRYRSVRAAYPESTLINANLDTIDVDFLADVLQASEYTGECDAQVGMELLQAALWSLYTVVSGCCPDYFFIPPTSSPHLSHLRAAAAHCQKTRKRIQFSAKTQDTVPLTPLEAYVALMPTEASLPRGVASALQQRKHHITAHTLQTSNDVSVIATAAKAAVAASAEFLTPSERFLRSFTAPVRLNVVPPRKRLSRHEQHYMMKKHGRIIVEEPIPVVERIDDSNTPTMSYAHVDYPSSVEELSFLTPFDAAPQQGSGGKRRGGAAGSSSSLRSISIHNTSANEEHNSAATKMERTLAEVVESGSRLPEKRVRAMKRRLHRLQSINMKELRGEADDLNLMDRGDGAQLHEELAQFLGSEHDARHILQESKREAMHDSQKKQKLLMKRAEKDEVKGTRQDQSAKKASTPTTKQRLAGGNKKKLTTPAVASSSSSSSLLNNHKTKQTKKKSREGG